MKFEKPVQATVLAELIGARILGDGTMMVSGINEIHRVEAGDLTFVDHPKYYDKALHSAATFVLINQEREVPAGKCLLFSERPFQDYVFLTKHFMPFPHASGQIDPSAHIGSGTRIEPGAIIGPDVHIGENCLIHSGAVIGHHTILGNNVIIQANSVLGGDAFYYKKTTDGFQKMHSCGRVVIEDDVEVGSSCTIDRGVSSDTRIGRGTKLDNQIHIGHDTVIGQYCLIAAQTGVAGCVNIEDGVILWGQVGVQKDLTIGKNAIVLAQSGVSKSLKGDQTYFGSPAQEVKTIYREMALVRRLPEIVEKLK